MKRNTTNLLLTLILRVYGACFRRRFTEFWKNWILKKRRIFGQHVCLLNSEPTLREHFSRGNTLLCDGRTHSKLCTNIYNIYVSSKSCLDTFCFISCTFSHNMLLYSRKCKRCQRRLCLFCACAALDAKIGLQARSRRTV